MKITTTVGARITGEKALGAGPYGAVQATPGELLQPEAPEVAAWQCRVVWRVRIPPR